MILPIVIVIVFLLITTIMREGMRCMWRRSLLRNMMELKRSQASFVNSGNNMQLSSEQLNGRWSFKWRDGRMERVTVLTLDMDPITGILSGSGQDEIGHCTIEGMFRQGKDRVAWTQTYQLRRNTTILVEVWGYITIEAGWRLSARGQFQSNEALGRRGFFVMRPIFLDSLASILFRDLAAPTDEAFPPVQLEKVEEGFCLKDSTCTICLEDCERGAVRLPCMHIYHEECVQKWLKRSNECPTCKQTVRAVHTSTNRDETSGGAHVPPHTARLDRELRDLHMSLRSIESELSSRRPYFAASRAPPFGFRFNQGLLLLGIGRGMPMRRDEQPDSLRGMPFSIVFDGTESTGRSPEISAIVALEEGRWGRRARQNVLMEGWGMQNESSNLGDGDVMQRSETLETRIEAHDVNGSQNVNGSSSANGSPNTNGSPNANSSHVILGLGTPLRRDSEAAFRAVAEGM